MRECDDAQPQMTAGEVSLFLGSSTAQICVYTVVCGAVSISVPFGSWMCRRLSDRTVEAVKDSLLKSMCVVSRRQTSTNTDGVKAAVGRKKARTVG